MSADDNSQAFGRDQRMDYMEYYLRNGSHHPKVSKKTKHSLRCASFKFSIVDDKLHYIGKGRRQLVVRSDEHREKIVSSHHISGETHNGIIATHTKIVAKYYWIAMIADIKQHILRCKTCATNKEKMAEVKKKRKEDTCDNTPDANDPWLSTVLDPAHTYDDNYRLEYVYYYKKHGNLLPLIPALKKSGLRKAAANFEVRGTDMYYVAKGQEKFVCRTVDQKKDAFLKCHCRAGTNQHKGVNQTMIALVKKYYWTRMTKDIQEWVGRCEFCNNLDTESLLTTPPSYTIGVTQPWECVAVDILGPFTTTNRSNRYVCSLTDLYSKYVYAQPMSSRGISDVCQVLLEFVYLYGPPRKFVSDKRREFVTELRNVLATTFGPEHPIDFEFESQCNRQDLRIKLALFKYCKEDELEWDSHLKAVVYSLNTSRQSLAVALPYDALYKRGPTSYVTSVSEEYELIAKAKQLDAETKSRIGSAEVKPEPFGSKIYLGKRTEHFNIGDVVLKRKAKTGKPKLEGGPEYCGPYIVTALHCHGIVTITNTTHSRKARVNMLTRLKEDESNSEVEELRSLYLPSAVANVPEPLSVPPPAKIGYLTTNEDGDSITYSTLPSDDAVQIEFFPADHVDDVGDTTDDGYTVATADDGYTVSTTDDGYTVSTTDDGYTVSTTDDGYTVATTDDGYTVSTADDGYTVSTADDGYTVSMPYQKVDVYYMDSDIMDDSECLTDVQIVEQLVNMADGSVQNTQTIEEEVFMEEDEPHENESVES